MRAAIYLHNNRNLTVTGNTTFNSSQAEFMVVNDNGVAPIRNVALSGNTFFSNLVHFSSSDLYFE